VDFLSELFSFQGRANRGWYISHVLLDDFVIVMLMVLMVVVGMATGTPLFVLPLAGVLVGAVVAATSVSVKRLHDLNMSGWHVLGMAVPLYNIYLGFKMLLIRGTMGPNRFGADPLMPNLPVEPGTVGVPEIEGPWIEGP